jgi:two-component system, cell cycle response regulator DivK
MSTILIVEDNDKNMKLMRDVLRHAGHTTLEATTGEAAVQMAICNPPDLILMDVQLPGMSGIAALQKIREEAALQAVPVIAVSASVMPDDHRSIVNSGFDAFMTKPIALKTLRATVERFLGGRRPR